jgi:ubiquitin-protein ligase E3 C
MFNPKELQLLIGGEDRAIDIVDMMAHVGYGGGYAESQPYIQAFWEIIASMSSEQQQRFLKFVTSCPRSPLLGFEQLTPKFGILKVPTHGQFDDPLTVSPKLPSAATCMNLLKLPQYCSYEMLREKLLYAIESNSGFELS